MKFMPVQCISERKGYNKLVVGNKYLLDKDGEYVAEYTSAKEAWRKTGISDTVIGKVCKG